MADVIASVTEMMCSSVNNSVDRSAYTTERMVVSVDDNISIIRIATERSQKVAQDLAENIGERSMEGIS